MLLATLFLVAMYKPFSHDLMYQNLVYRCEIVAISEH